MRHIHSPAICTYPVQGLNFGVATTNRGAGLATYTSSTKKNLLSEFFGGLATFYRRRWLLRYFVHRQLTRSYQRSYLGFAWAVLSPLVWVFFLTLIFSNIVEIGRAHV